MSKSGLANELLQSPTTHETLSEPSALPLRSLTIGTQFNSGVSFPEVLAKRCLNLTELKVHVDIFLRPVAGLEQLHAIQRIIFAPSFGNLASLCEKYARENRKDLTQLIASVPPQLADLRNVYFEGFIHLPLSAITLFAADTISETESALQSIPLPDALSLLPALCVDLEQSMSSRVDLEAVRIHKIRRLMDLGADPYKVVHPRRYMVNHVLPTTFHIAIAHGNHSVVSALYSYVDPSQIERIRSADGFTPLHERPTSFDSWKVCYDWHRANVPGWRLDDCKNLRLQTPLVSLFSSPTDLPMALMDIILYIIKDDPDVWNQEMRASTFNQVVSVLVPAVKAGLLPNSFDDQIKQLLEAFFATNCDFSGNLGDLLCLVLAGGFASKFDSLASNATAKDYASVFSCLNYRMSMQKDVPEELLDHLLEHAKRNQIDFNEIDRIEGEPLIQRCLGTHNFIFVGKLLDAGFSPPLSTVSEAQDFVLSLFSNLSLLNMTSRSNVPYHAQLLVQFLKSFLRLDRADMAAFLLETLMADHIHHQLLRPPESSSLALESWEQLSLLFFASPEAMTLIHNPVVLDSDSKRTIDMSTTLIFILLWPNRLPGLDFSSRRDCVHRLVAGMSSRTCFRHTTLSQVSHRYYSVFHPAAQALIQGDPENVQFVMSVLPQLVHMFEQTNFASDFGNAEFVAEIRALLQELSQDSNKSEAVKLFSRVEIHASKHSPNLQSKEEFLQFSSNT